jgi:hypothetical protein
MRRLAEASFANMPDARFDLVRGHDSGWARHSGSPVSGDVVGFVRFLEQGDFRRRQRHRSRGNGVCDLGWFRRSHDRGDHPRHPLTNARTFPRTFRTFRARTLRFVAVQREVDTGRRP